MAVLTFGEFRLDTVNRQLWRGEQPVELSGISFAVLSYLAERSTGPSGGTGGGHLVTKQELRDLFWRDAQVSEETVRSCMSAIRKALGDDPQQPRYLKTQTREGWRFVMNVTTSQPKAGAFDHLPQPHGGLYDPSCYIDRPSEERDILGCIKYPGRPVVIYGPQGCGKSTLISRALESVFHEKADAPSCRVIRINVRALAEENLDSFDTMLQELGRQMLDPADLAIEQTQATLSELWAKNLDGKLKLKRLVRTQVLQPGQVVYLVLANVEHLAAWRFQASWFDMFRAWQEVEELSGLRLIVETAIPPRLFSLGGHSPLWTKSKRIPVPGLDAGQIVRLAAAYGLRASLSSCAELGEIVGGLAMLCRSALSHAATHQQSLEEVVKNYRGTGRDFGMFNDHLEDIEHWLDYQRHAAGNAPTLKVITSRLLAEAARGISLNNEEAWPAVRKGLLTETQTRGVYRLRCRLYEEYFAESAP